MLHFTASPCGDTFKRVSDSFHCLSLRSHPLRHGAFLVQGAAMLGRGNCAVSFSGQCPPVKSPTMLLSSSFYLIFLSRFSRLYSTSRVFSGLSELDVPV